MFMRSLNHNVTVLQIELTNGTACISIPVVTLPLCPRHWMFRASEYISDLRVTGYVFPTLNVAWHGFSMTNNLTNHTLKPDPKVRLNFLTGLIIRRILRTDCSAFLYLSHFGYAFNFSVAAEDETEMNLETNC